MHQSVPAHLAKAFREASAEVEQSLEPLNQTTAAIEAERREEKTIDGDVERVQRAFYKGEASEEEVRAKEARRDYLRSRSERARGKAIGDQRAAVDRASARKAEALKPIEDLARAWMDEYHSDLIARIDRELEALLKPVTDLGIGIRDLDIKQPAALRLAVRKAFDEKPAPQRPTFGIKLDDGRIVPADSPEGRAKQRELDDEVRRKHGLTSPHIPVRPVG